MMEPDSQDSTLGNSPAENSELSPTSVTPFLSGHGRAQSVIALFVFGILLSAVMLASDLSEFQLIGRIVDGVDVTEGEIKSNDNRQAALALVYLVWFAAIVITFLMWVHRTHRNLPALRATNLEFSPRGAVGWYFVPFVNLFKPYQCMREIFNASDPADAPEGGSDWKLRSAPAIVKSWWAIFLFLGFLGNMVARASWRADTLEAHQIVAAASVVDGTVSIVAMLAAIWLVRSIDWRQKERASILELTPTPLFMIDGPIMPRA